jgi:hypothetical protein
LLLIALLIKAMRKALQAPLTEPVKAAIATLIHEERSRNPIRFIDFNGEY